MNPQTTLADARSWLRERVHGGEKCPCCTQFAKVYRRKINSQMVVALLRAWRENGYQWFHLATLDKSREASKLAYWELIEEEPERREDGGRSSWWRVTPLGRAFIYNLITVPKYALVYDGRLMSLDETQRVTIIDALGTRFNYDDLMTGN